MNILIGGEAGQGLLTVGQSLARSLEPSGYSILVTQTDQSRIRGGHNSFAIRVGEDEVIAPVQSADLWVAVDAETVVWNRGDLTLDGMVVVDGALEVVGEGLLKVLFKEIGSPSGSSIETTGHHLSTRFRF